MTPEIPETRLRRFPETVAGGFSRVDGNIDFYGRVQALMGAIERSDTVVVDYGAGRGAAADDPVVYRRQLSDLRHPRRTVLAVDVDPAVADNPRVDRRHVLDPSSPHIPVDDGSVDLIVSDWVFEHLKDPAASTLEFARILRPGGWLCARTPNRWGYIALGARLVPNRLHEFALRRAQPDKPGYDTFPTFYRANTERSLGQLLGAAFDVTTWCVDYEPDLYSGGNATAERILSLFRFAPPGLRSVRLVFAQRR